MPDSEKSGLRAPRFCFFFSSRVLAHQHGKADWEESQWQSYEMIHSPAVGRLSITECEACPDIF